jgi:predicted transcriptional regulator
MVHLTCGVHGQIRPTTECADEGIVGELGATETFLRLQRSRAALLAKSSLHFAARRKPFYA